MPKKYIKKPLGTCACGAEFETTGGSDCCKPCRAIKMEAQQKERRKLKARRIRKAIRDKKAEAAKVVP